GLAPQALGLAPPSLGLAPSPLGLASPSLAPPLLASSLLVSRSAVAGPQHFQRSHATAFFTAQQERRLSMKLLAASLLSLRLGLQGAGEAGGADGSVAGRSHPGRAGLRPGLPPRALWRLPSALQLPAGLAHRALRQALLSDPPLLIGTHNERQGSRDPCLSFF